MVVVVVVVVVLVVVLVLVLVLVLVFVLVFVLVCALVLVLILVLVVVLVSDRNLASHNTIITTMIPAWLVYEVMQDFDHQLNQIPNSIRRYSL